MKNKSLFNNIKKTIKNGLWIFLTAMAVEAFTFRIPYCIVLGIFLLFTSFLFFPWLDKLLNIIKIKLTNKNKLFIFSSNFLVAAYLIKPDDMNYYKCIIPILLMITMWVLVILYIKFFNFRFKTK